MKKSLGWMLLACWAFAGWAGAAEIKTVYGFKVKTLEGKALTLSHYQGKTLLIVNVASKCGFTPQYEGLEKLYQKYKDRGFVILGFPCNQFGGQEPGTAAEIKTFCTSKYDVTFPLFEKIEVNGPHNHPLYQFLEKALPGGDIGWNFTKFLIDSKGRPVKRFASPVKPAEIDGEVAALLNRK